MKKSDNYHLVFLMEQGIMRSLLKFHEDRRKSAEIEEYIWTVSEPIDLLHEQF